MAENGRDLPIVSPSLLKWKPVFIEQFDLGIGEEWLPRVGMGDETSDEVTECTSDVTEWLSRLPDVGSVMECDEDESMSMWSADVTRNNESSNGSVKPTRNNESTDGSVKPTKRLKLSLSRTKNKTATAPLKDCSNDLSRFIVFAALITGVFCSAHFI